MDNAVAIVQTYLRVNGFLTVTEYPILHRHQDGQFQEVTDIDVLAARYPEAGRVLPRPDGGAKMHNDPALDLAWGRPELLIGEVKEGVARINTAMFRKDVLYEALRRFGACPRDELHDVVRRLLDSGSTTLSDGTRVRLVVFASREHEGRRSPFTFIPLADVLTFLRAYIRGHWQVQGSAGFRDPILNMLALLEKARGEPGRQGSGADDDLFP